MQPMDSFKDVVIWQRYMPRGYLALKKLPVPLLNISQFTHMSFKAIKEKQQKQEESVCCVELYPYNEAVHNFCKHYYDHLIQLTEQYNKLGKLPKAFLRVFDYGVHEMAVSNRKQLQKYTYITREYLENASSLSSKPSASGESRSLEDARSPGSKSLTSAESRWLGLQIIELLGWLSKKEDIHYGEISPNRILRAPPMQDSNEFDTFKVVDSFIYYAHKPPISQANFKGLDSSMYYLSHNMLRNKLMTDNPSSGGNQTKITFEDDCWGLQLTMLRFIPNLRIYDKHETFASLVAAVSNYQGMDLDRRYKHCESRLEIKEQIYQNFVKGMCLTSSDKEQERDLTELETTIKNFRSGPPPKNQERAEAQQVENERSTRQNSMVQENIEDAIHNIEVDSSSQFYTIVEEQNGRSQQQQEADILATLQRVAFTVFGNRVLVMKEFTVGNAQGAVEMIQPNQKRVSVVFEGPGKNAIRVTCLIRDMTINEICKVHLFFKYDGSNPLNMTQSDLEQLGAGTTSVSLDFTAETGDDRGQKKSYRSDQILQYTETSIRQMEDRLRGLELSKAAIENLKNIKKRFKQSFNNSVDVNLFKRQGNDYDFRYESVALLGCNFSSMQSMNLAANSLTDDFMEVLKSKKSSFFQGLNTLKLSHNMLTDKSLEIMVECFRRAKGKNFSMLQTLLLDYNRIEECMAFRLDGLPRLKLLDLDHNMIKKFDQYSFKKLKSIRIIYLKNQHTKTESKNDPLCECQQLQNDEKRQYTIFFDKKAS